MIVENLQCSSDIAAKIPKKLKKLNIKNINMDTDTTVTYIQGKVKERSALQKTKRFDYMKVCLQEDEDVTCHINVFVTGSIAKEMDVVQTDFTLVLSGFVTEENTRVTASSHPCQLVLDEELSSPRVWYVDPPPDFPDSQEATTSTRARGRPAQTHMPRARTDMPQAQIDISRNQSVHNTASGQRGADTPTKPSTARTKPSTPKKGYTYPQLSAVKPNTVVDVYGVVKFVKPPCKTRGNDHSMLVTLVDSSLCSIDRKLKCVLFHRDQDQFPSVEVGDIIRFHRLKVTMYSGDIQGQNGPGFSWLYVSGSPADPIEPKVSSCNYSFTDKDTEKIEELRHWREEDGRELSQEDKNRNGKIEDIVPGLYFDLVCQVISTQVVEVDTCVTLKVWDGTRTIYMVRELDSTSDALTRKTHHQLESRAKDFAVDVALYDDHFIKAVDIQPGQYIKLSNLHAAKLKTTEARDHRSALPALELVIHRGTSFGRGVFVMEAESPDVITLIDRLDSVALDDINEIEAMGLFDETMTCGQADSTSDSVCRQMDVDNVQSSSGGHNTRQRKRIVSDEPLDESCRKRTRLNSNLGNMTHNCDESTFNGTSNQSALELTCESPDIDRCMLQTETVILNHPHVKRTKICDIESHSVPYKFRVQGHIEDYFPRPVTVAEDLVRLYCPQCHYLGTLPKMDSGHSADTSTDVSSSSCDPDVKLSHVNAGIRYYRCPICKDHPDGKPVDLTYTYMLRLLIRDASGWIQANLWRDEAVVFFKDIDPRDVVMNKKNFHSVCDQLDQICPCPRDASPSPGEEKPWVECGVMSFSCGLGTGYNIFDTCVA